MITLDVYQGSDFATVLQAMDRTGNPPLYFLSNDLLSGAVWNGQTQEILFSPQVSWFTGLLSITLTNGGNGYTTPPVVTISGGGAVTNATAVATVTNGSVTEISIGNAGAGYTFAPTITISGPGSGAAAIGVPAFGWQTGLVSIGITAAQTVGLDPQGQYRFRATAVRDTTTPLIDCLVAVFASPGTSTRTILTYSTYQDILDMAPWITGVQDVETDQQGFYSQRLRARLWLDDIIINRFQNNYVGQYGAHSQSAFDALGNQNTIGPSPIIINALAANQLILRPAIVEVCSHYAIGLIGIAQVITGNQNLMKMGQYHIAKALREVSGITAEIDTNADGLADMLANLSTVNTIFG